MSALSDFFKRLTGAAERDLEAEVLSAKRELAVVKAQADVTRAKLVTDGQAALLKGKADLATAVVNATPDIKTAVEAAVAVLEKNLLTVLA